MLLATCAVQCSAQAEDTRHQVETKAGIAGIVEAIEAIDSKLGTNFMQAQAGLAAQNQVLTLGAAGGR